MKLHGGGTPNAHGIPITKPRNYELFTEVMFLGRRRRSMAKLVELAEVGPRDRVLDIGCGTGYLTRLAAAAAPDGEVIGVDPSPPVLDYARQVTKAANCSYRIGAAQDLDLPDDSFDVVLTNFAVHHVPAEVRDAAFGEMRRVLRTGGRLVIGEFRPPRGLAGRLMRALVPPMMEHNMVDELPPAIRAAGFEIDATGDLPPLVSYVRATKGR
ncbi:MAG TPA: class I SAM-dependent methyltransferase [Pseudonocardiaceae bacterium]|nr:class I SAM-dependent methyltransferase [Pseudonocardiaceae bacterium]